MPTEISNQQIFITATAAIQRRGRYLDANNCGRSLQLQMTTAADVRYYSE